MSSGRKEIGIGHHVPTSIRLAALAVALVPGGCSACIANDPAMLRHRDVGSEDVAPETDASDPEAHDDSYEADCPDDQEADDVSIPDVDVVEVVEDVEIEFTSFVLIDVGDPPATFAMGAPSGSPGYMEEEVEHAVTLTKSFEIMVNEVTQAEFEALMRYNPSDYDTSGRATHPVEQVSWHEAAAYANALSSKDGLSLCYDCTTPEHGPDVRCSTAIYGLPPHTPYSCPGGYRLPTEAEWEYAARAGTTTSTYNGDVATEYLYACPPEDEPCPVLLPIAWFCGNSLHVTHQVRTRAPNDWGLYDMLGNVGEWCFDWYAYYPGDVTDPWGPTTGTERVFRGGSLLDSACLLRAACRDSDIDTTASWILGFRLVRNP